MFKKILLIPIATFLLFSFTEHKYYLSLTDIKHNEKSKSLQIIATFFMDDIETVLNSKYNIDLQLASNDELKDNDQYFKEYMKEKLIFKINDTPKNFSYLGKEYSGELVSFYLEIENIAQVSSIAVKSTMLMETFISQQNLIKAKIKGERKSVVLTLKKDKGLLKF